jgi:predicted alpha/beta hydrolase family esterase
MKIDFEVRVCIVGSLSLFVAMSSAALSLAQEPTNVISPSSHYVSNNNNSRVIVFVHGLNGNARDTWLFDPTHYWPQMIADDPSFADTDIYAASYPTPTRGNHMSVNDLISYLSDELEADGVFSKHKQVLFVAHSLGGIVVQELLLTYRDKNLASKVPFIYLYATPQTGSDLANIGKIFKPDPLIKELAHGDGNFVLSSMDNAWLHSGFQSIKRYCAYETQTEKGFKVVGRESATRGCDDYVAIDSNHRNIVKPADDKARSYTALKNKFADLIALPDTVATVAPSQQSQPLNQNCPGGICIAGPNSGSPAVYNFEKPDPPARNISQKNGEAAVSILQAVSPGQKIEIEMVGQTPEIDHFTRQIMQVFVDAKWNPNIAPTINFSLTYKMENGYSVYRGEEVVCYYHPQPTPKALAVVKAMNATGYPCREIPSDYAPEIELIVGTRYPAKQ